MKIKLKFEDIQKMLTDDIKEYPKYATQIMNLANSNAQGTRPRVVGQMSDLIPGSGVKTIEEWKTWYQQHYPGRIEIATEKIYAMIENLKLAIIQIDKKMVIDWLEDFIYVKTFIGLKFQEAILKKIAQDSGVPYRLAEPEEESKGIDGYIDDKPVSIKPLTYKTKDFLRENIEIPIILYDKKKDGIVLEYDLF